MACIPLTTLTTEKCYSYFANDKRLNCQNTSRTHISVRVNFLKTYINVNTSDALTSIYFQALLKLASEKQ